MRCTRSARRSKATLLRSMSVAFDANSGVISFGRSAVSATDWGYSYERQESGFAADLASGLVDGWAVAVRQRHCWHTDGIRDQRTARRRHRGSGATTAARDLRRRGATAEHAEDGKSTGRHD